jgi:hypothetical protein
MKVRCTHGIKLLFWPRMLGWGRVGLLMHVSMAAMVALHKAHGGGQPDHSFNEVDYGLSISWM